MTNLDSVFRESARRAADSVPDPEGIEPLRRAKRSIARRRVVRATGTTSMVLAIVGGLAVGAWALYQNEPIEPAPQPSGSSIGPIPDPTDDAIPVSPSPSVDELLLDTVPTPEGILGRAEPGWVLAVYRPWQPSGDEDGAVDGNGGVSEPVAQVLYLIEPDGTRYELARFDTSLSVELLRWQAGDTTAIVRWGTRESSSFLDEQLEYLRSGDSHVQSLNLESGAFGPLPADVPTNALEFVGEMSGGVDVWEVLASDGTDLLAVDPDGTIRSLASLQGTYFSLVDVIPDPTATIIALPADGAYTLIDVADGSSARYEIAPPVDGLCRIVGWWTADSLLAECLTDEQVAENEGGNSGTWATDPDLYIVTAGSPSTPLVFLRDVAETEPFAGDYRTTLWLDDSRVVIPAVPWSYPSPQGLWFFDGDAYTMVPESEASWIWVEISDGVVYFSSNVCAQEECPRSLVRYDPTTGGSVTLVPRPRSFEGLYGKIWLESWAVGK